MSSCPGSRLILALPALVLSAFTVSGASPPDTHPAAACAVSADTVRIGQSMAPVAVRYSEEIGDSLTASVAPASKVLVTGVRKGGTPLTGEISLNTEQATAGDWDLTLAGSKSTCSGTLTVQPGKKA